MRVCFISAVCTDTLRPWLGDAIRKYGEISPGAGGHVVTALVAARLRRGLQTDVIGLDSTAAQYVKCWDSGLLRCWLVRCRKRHFLRDFYREELYGLQQAIISSSAEVIHAHWTYACALAACRQKAIPWVLTVHDHAGRCLRHTGAWYIVHYLITRYVYRKVRHVTAVSPYVAEYAARCSGRHVDVIPNVLPEGIWQMAGDAAGAVPVIISVINWGRLKNGCNALRAFRLVRQEEPMAEYHLYGPGLGPQEEGERWAQKHGLHHGVKFCGTVSNPEILRRISKATLLLHPSLEESFGGPVAEALALRTPVVATRQARGVVWLLGQGSLGRLADGRLPQDLASAVMSVLRNRTENQRMVQEGQRHIRTLTDTDTILGEYDRVYRKAMKY